MTYSFRKLWKYVNVVLFKKVTLVDKNLNSAAMRFFAANKINFLKGENL